MYTTQTIYGQVIMATSFKDVWQAIERHDLRSAKQKLDNISCNSLTDQRNQLALTALIEARLNNYDGALKAIQAVIEMGDPIANDYNLLGNIYLKKNDYPQAIAAYQQAISLEANYSNAHTNLAYAYQCNDEHAAALAIYQQRYDLDPTESIPAYQLSIVALKGEDYENAFNLIRYAYDADPDNTKLMTQYAQSAFLNNDFQRVVEIFSEKDLTSMLLIDTEWYLAQSYFKLKQYAQAKQHAAAILAKDPAYDQINCLLGHIALAESDYHTALKYYLRQAEREASAEVYFNIAVILTAKQRQKEAMEYYRQALKLDENYVACYQNIGLIYLSQGSTQDALEAYRQAQALDPTNKEVNYICQALSGDLDQPSSPPPSFVSNLFDQYAPYYDTHLIETLRYQVPEQCVDLLLSEGTLNKDNPLTICDLGCGTGLVGMLLTPYASSLTGIDISEQMITLARKKKIYNALLIGDISEVINTLQNFDLIVAGDMLPYIGDVSALFKILAKHLNKDGTICLSFEVASDNNKDKDYSLQQSARYAHSITYIEQIAQINNLLIHAKTATILRQDHKKAVKGCIVILKHNLASKVSPT